MAMKIYTRTGDGGDTGLFGGGRVRKNDVRVAAYGDVDELNSSIGVARALAPSITPDLLEAVQRDLFAIGGHLATPDPDKVRRALARAELSDTRVQEFETAIDRAEEELAPLTAFILPGGTHAAAAFHVARTVCRRAERSVITLADEAEVPPLFLVYLNRLSDLLFTLARLANRRADVEDVTW